MGENWTLSMGAQSYSSPLRARYAQADLGRYSR